MRSTYSHRQPLLPAFPFKCLYTAAWSTPENLTDVSNVAFDRGSQVSYNVPMSPELVKIPERFPSSPGLYHLRCYQYLS